VNVYDAADDDDDDEDDEYISVFSFF